MGAIEDHNIYGLTVRESATDGSDFTNPGADYRRLFLGEDGQLHVKDSAGAVTDIGSGSGNVATDAIWDAAGDIAVGTGANTGARVALGAAGGAVSRINGAVAWNSGTAFPTAATGDRFYRTNIRGGMTFIYDGTRWVSEQLFLIMDERFSGLAASSSSVYWPLPADYPLWVDSWDHTLFVSATATWVSTLIKGDFDLAETNIATKSTAAQTGAKMYHYHDSIGVVVDGSGGNTTGQLTYLNWFMDEQSGTATCSGAVRVYGRLIAT
jgi:hypothetical protein